MHTVENTELENEVHDFTNVPGLSLQSLWAMTPESAKINVRREIF